MYYQATKDAVKNINAAGKKINMLDIGTGTGLLAMMAVRSGADGATACEVTNHLFSMHETNCVILDSQICLLCICQAFEPIAKVASEIVKKNGFGDKISVIGKRSTELSMEEGKKIHHFDRCNSNYLLWVEYGAE